MGSDEKSKKRRSRSISEDEGRKKKHRTRDERERKKDKSDKKEKTKSKKSHKHSKRDSDKGKKSKEKHDRKHHKRDRHSLIFPDDRVIFPKCKFQELSKDDYFSKNNEFATWLKEERALFFSDLSSDAARELFQHFIKDWNSQKLESRYYEGISSGPRTRHDWRIGPEK